MAWIKIPPEHHPLFQAALPKDKRVETLQMMLPEDVFHDPAELRQWLRRAFDFTAALPRKAKPAAKAAAKPKPKPARRAR